MIKSMSGLSISNSESGDSESGGSVVVPMGPITLAGFPALSEHPNRPPAGKDGVRVIEVLAPMRHVQPFLITQAVLNSP
jgi:hypothetical protein